jgi:uncharacterized membrane protein YwaF
MTFLPFHLAFMSLACLCMIAAVLTARFLKSRAWWMKVHRALNYAALGSLAVGLSFAVIMVSSAGETQAGLPHRLLGAVSILGSLVLVFLGRSIFRQKGKEAIASRKKTHRWLGRLEALLMPGALLLGLLLIGLL